jgi:hypothetical protein
MVLRIARVFLVADLPVAPVKIVQHHAVRAGLGRVRGRAGLDALMAYARGIDDHDPDTASEIRKHVRLQEIALEIKQQQETENPDGG